MNVDIYVCMSFKAVVCGENWKKIKSKTFITVTSTSQVNLLVAASTANAKAHFLQSCRYP